MRGGLLRGVFIKKFHCVSNKKQTWTLATSRNRWNTSFLSVIQIKICAEYRDMLPRPMPVCQEPLLRPIGRSSGVPDIFSRGLGSMSRYSAQILICFIAYIFHCLIPLWVWLETSQNCHHAQCSLPLAITIKMMPLIRQSYLPACWGAAAWTLSGNYATDLMKLTHKLYDICVNGKFSVQESSELRVSLHTCEYFYCMSAKNLDWLQKCWK